ncbi:uncharacterized protein LOC116268311 [Nymphaea colorata]|uniref:RING-type domain-containing protein n=1 Tax=Nymphaea colorata TaxID=210225 RepID=A0A5K0WHY3_9MAGN|nr:uncharacterized protein LOC116268311 [Nymphaea colorata]
MRRQDGDAGEHNVGFSVPAEITQAVKALIDLLLEEAEPTRRSSFFCCEEMEAERRSSRKWKVLRGKLKLRGIGCCGSSWSSAALDGDDMAVAEGEEEAEARDVCTPHHHDTEMERTESIEEEEPPRVEEQDQEEEEESPREEEEEENQNFERSRTGTTENETTEAASMIRREATMNLAAALAAERHLRAAQDCEQTESMQQPFRVSLMALLEQEHEGGNGNDNNNKNKKKGGRGAEESPGAGCCSCCCVCMSREKGAAFIPCGHTFCRACSRELWLNRGSCPLCNRQILEILDIF